VASVSRVSARVRSRRFTLPAIVAVVAAVGATVVVSGVGQASPASHLSLAQVQSRVNALNARAERITEAYDSANTQLAALRKKEQATNNELRRDEGVLAAVQKRLAVAAAAAYRNGALNPTLSLVTSGDPQTYLNQAGSLDAVARYDASMVSSASAARRLVAGVRVVHDAQVAAQRKTVSSLSSEKSQIDNLLGQQNALLARLKASQRQALAARQAATARHEVALRTSYHPPTYNGPASGNAAAAIAFAYAQLGKPYQWGGAGPNSYDCSGLTMRSWGAAGVSLPHSAAGQQAMLPRVSLSDLEPGDLVFYGYPAYHVAMYIGGGRIIQAPHTGTVVSISSLSSMTPTSAGRP